MSDLQQPAPLPFDCSTNFLDLEGLLKIIMLMKHLGLSFDRIRSGNIEVFFRQPVSSDGVL